MTLGQYVKQVPKWERVLNRLATVLDSYKNLYGSLPEDKRTVDWLNKLK